jgi:hypothetical protein
MQIARLPLSASGRRGQSRILLFEKGWGSGLFTPLPLAGEGPGVRAPYFLRYNTQSPLDGTV